MPYTKVDHLLYNRYRSTEQLPGIGDNWVENLPSNRPNKTAVSSAKILSSSNKEVQIGGELELQCVAHEEPPFKIWWWLNGTRLDILKYEGNFKHDFKIFFKNSSFQTKSFHLVKNDVLNKIQPNNIDYLILFYILPILKTTKI